MREFLGIADRLDRIANEIIGLKREILALCSTERERAAIEIYRMSEAELRQFAASRGLSEVMIETLVLKVIHRYKNVEIQQERGYSKSAIKYHIRKIKERIGVDYL